MYRPATGKPELLTEVPPLVLGSIHAPIAGTTAGEFARRYSVAWQKCEPANAAAQAACILVRPPSLPVVAVVVKPAKRTLAGVLQQASAREAEQPLSTETSPAGVSQWP